ncbi:MAG: DUF5011 domain-containing protein, partial [Lachnospiraceae bacterium]|nr:DUF5011 domain-containing protein [Lachnospiraceae bacterium]
MTDNKSNRRKEKALTAGVLIGAVLIAAAGFVLWNLVFRKPVLILKSDKAQVEAGKTFDSWALVDELKYVHEDQVTVDTSKLNTQIPGTYEVTYTLVSLTGEQSLPVSVTVSDTTPPELELHSDTFETDPGDVIDVREVIKRVSDHSGVRVLFSDGETEKVFTEPGSYDVNVKAVDGAGNVTEKTAVFVITAPDNQAPVILGTRNVCIAVGENFDVMDGVSVRDDYDPKPKLTADVEKVDTSRPGFVEIHYTATDQSGKKTQEDRVVTIADEVLEAGGTRYGVFWDLTGREGQPYLVAVNRALNTVTVYQQDAEERYTVPVQAFVCSTGKDTPAGTYTTLERTRWQYLFDDCWGQYATRIVDHILFHSVPYFTQDQGNLEYEEYNLLGTSASLGCVRLSVADVKWIYDNCPSGFTCVIYDDPVFPGPLGKPGAAKIDVNDERRGWDPTDPDPGN